MTEVATKTNAPDADMDPDHGEGRDRHVVFVGGGLGANPHLKGIPKFFCFGGLVYQGRKATDVQEYSVLLALPPSAARPKNLSFLEVCVLLASVPRPSKKQMAKQELRDPFDTPGPDLAPPLGPGP